MQQLQISKVKEIYGLFADETSKYIFENRLMYSMTDDSSFMRNVVYTMEEARIIYARLKESKKKVGIFGAGVAGRYLLETFADIQFECYIDNNCAGTMCRGLPVISLQEFKEKYFDDIVMISSRVYYKEILAQLLEEGFHSSNIINVGEVSDRLRHLQYFDLPYLKEKKIQREVFVDGGCFDGDTSIGFSNWCAGEGYVYAWEPDPINFKQCERLFESNNISYRLIPKGLWSSPKKLKLRTAGGCSTITDEEWNTVIEVDCIDRLINEPVTFIKMDIEGSEHEALLGAERMISQHSPKLAISIYHKPEDIWELPWLIHKFNPTYRFYLRHYSLSWSETVLYAI